MKFSEWFNDNCEDFDLCNFPVDAMEYTWNTAVNQTAKRCKEITQQRYLAKDQAVEIDKKISEEFKL